MVWRSPLNIVRLWMAIHCFNTGASMQVALFFCFKASFEVPFQDQESIDIAQHRNPKTDWGTLGKASYHHAITAIHPLQY